MIKIGVVGLGYWGPNLARNFDALPDSELKYCCDAKQENLDKHRLKYPEAIFTPNFDDLISDDGLDAVVVATHVPSHFELTERALKAGKDVFVEKPISLSPGEALTLKRIAEADGRVLMVGHLLQYHPAVDKLKSLLGEGVLGDLFYIYTTRVNLGQVRSNENALWSLGPHDVSVIIHLIGEQPIEVSARGESYIQGGIEDVVFVDMKFANKVMAHMQMSWLDPHKMRKITLVGSEKMVVFDDMSTDEKIRLYDKGVYKPDFETYGEYISLRFGDIHIPKINSSEPLKIECQHFLDCIKNRTKPISDADCGLKVVRVLEAAQRSLDTGGESIPLETES